MTLGVAALVFVSLVSLGPSERFGDATATVLSVDEGRPTFGLTVDVSGAAAVVGHVARVDGSELLVAMAPLSPGSWGGAFTVGRVENVRVRFEAMFADGTSGFSGAASMIELGADASFFVGAPDATVAAGESTRSPAAPWAKGAAVIAVALLVLVSLIGLRLEADR